MRSSIQCSHLRMAALRMRAKPYRSHSLRILSEWTNVLRQLSQESLLSKAGALAGNEELIQIEAGGHRPLRIVRMDDGERNDDRARPRRHLVEQLARQQHDLRRNARRAFARIKIEEAEIDLGVAVGGLNAAEREDAFAQAASCASSSTGTPASFSAK